jgi:2-C-methyl-D-erythritol 4-phosphate cytidylyltransferase
MTVSVVIPAAGSSTRMGEGKKKEFLPLPSVLFPKEKKTTVLACTIQSFLVAFENSKDFLLKQIIIAIPNNQNSKKETEKAIFTSKKIKELLQKMNVELCFVTGDDTRQKSIFNCLQFLKDNNFEGQVTIHDGARPWVKPELILSVSKLAKEKGSGAPIIPCVDTLKVINSMDNSIQEHLERSKLGAIQTPQAFDFETLYQANLKAIENDFFSTDDTEIWSKFSGKKVFYCDGDVENKKITYKSDILKVKK